MNLYISCGGNSSNGMFGVLYYFGQNCAQGAANGVNLIILHGIDSFGVSPASPYGIRVSINGIVHMHRHGILAGVHRAEADIIQSEIIACCCRALIQNGDDRGCGIAAIPYLIELVPLGSGG